MAFDISRLRTSKQAFVFRSEFRTAVGPIEFIPIIIFSSWIFKKGAKNHAESFFFLGHSGKKLKPNLASILEPHMGGQRTLTQPFVSFRSPPICGPKTEAIFGLSLWHGEGKLFSLHFLGFCSLFPPPQVASNGYARTAVPWLFRNHHRIPGGLLRK